MLTQRKLKLLLSYNPSTGIFVWKDKRSYGRGYNLNNVKIGDRAGYIDTSGYRVIGIMGKYYLAHRLAWLYIYGYFPETQIDHINKIKSDNRINNLRMVSRKCNARNCHNRSNNTSGVNGVSWYKASRKWQVYITDDQKMYGLGSYKSFDEAVCTRLAAEQCLNWSGCDSNSSAYQYVQNMLKMAERIKSR